MACVYGFQNYHMKGDISASILIKALRMIEACLGCMVHVMHIPRCSDWESEMADNLSREKSTGFLETQTLRRFKHLQPPKRLTNWLASPVEDWNLATDLLLHVQERIASK
jgi:ethanolamine ammonia-lyase large subunit